jgi:hypothetical protein
MTPEELSREQLGLTSYLIDRVCGRALGRLDDHCDNNYPRDVYFIGNLRPQEEGPNRPGTAPHIPELMNKLSPTAFGAEFNIEPHDHARVQVELSWSCYYRVFPTYDQQLKHQEGLAVRQSRNSAQAATVVQQLLPMDEDDDSDLSDESEEAIPLGEDSKASTDAEEPAKSPSGNIDRSPGKRETLMPRFRKLHCSAAAEIGLDRTADGLWRANPLDLEQALESEVRRILTIIAADPEAARAEDDLYTQVRVPDSALRSSSAYDQFVATQNNDRAELGVGGAGLGSSEPRCGAGGSQLNFRE